MNIPVKTVAKLLGVGEGIIRRGLRQKSFDFGYSVKGSGDKYKYIVPHELFCAQTFIKARDVMKAMEED